MQKTAKFPIREKDVSLFIVDTRDFPTTAQLFGKIKVPLPIMQGARVRWKIPEFAYAPTGVTCDIRVDGLSIVFVFAERKDGLRKDGGELSFDDIVALFLKYEPSLVLIRKGH